MAAQEYDVVFVGGGLAAVLLLNELRPTLPERVAVVEPYATSERPLIHWSYWSDEQTPYDRFAIGAWRQARVGNTTPQSVARCA
jgi:lycopene beta-cyclase